MKKWLELYGIIGFILIILMEINFYLKISPLDKFYFPIIWLGYILLVDALAYKLHGKSMVKNKFKMLVGMFILSALFWKIFEYLNLRVQNWHYVGTEFFGTYGDLYGIISFSTVIPAFFVTLALFGFDFRKSLPDKKMRKGWMSFFIIVGLIMLLLPLIWPKYFFPFIWLFLFFILDSVNYYNKGPSVFYMIRKGKKEAWKIIISILILGFLWEFWNYWASVKWLYTIPFFDFWHVFEMPILGYLGYIPFGFEVFAFWFFVRSLFRRV